MTAASDSGLPVDGRLLAPLADAGPGSAVGELGEVAKEFLLAHKWCRALERVYVGYCIERVLGVFLVQVDGDPQADRYLWTIVGDLPPAYLVCDEAHTPAEAIQAYIAEMEKWVEAARRGRSGGRIVPVYEARGRRELPMTAENAKLLEVRLSFLKARVVRIVRDSDAALLCREGTEFADIEDRIA